MKTAKTIMYNKLIFIENDFGNVEHLHLSFKNNCSTYLPFIKLNSFKYIVGI